MEKMLVRPWVRRLAESLLPVEPDQYEQLRMNSYEREFLLPNLSDETLCQVAEHAVVNCTPMRDPTRPPVTYDESLMHRLVPELVTRLRHANGGLE